MPVIACGRCGAKNRVDPTRAGNLQPVCGRCGSALPADPASSSADGHPVEVTDATLSQVLATSGRVPVLVDCWAEWCPPCRMLSPTLDQLAADARGRFVIAKLNIDENPRTAQQFNVSSIPTMLLFKSGQLVDQIVGLAPKQAIEQRLAKHAS